jgi:hypothetical protein
VLRGCGYIAQTKPEPVYITCPAQIHNPSERRSAAILQVLKINTLAGTWMLRDIEQHNPEQRFAIFRKRNSIRYYTDGIATMIGEEYRDYIRSRYTMNANLFGSLCTTIASQISGYLQKVAEAERKGYLRQYKQVAAHIVTFGKHKGKALDTLGRKTIFGYAFIAPKRDECQKALRYINALLDDHEDNQELTDKTERYKMRFGPRRGRELGSLRRETLRRLKFLVEQNLARADDLDELRKVAQMYLRFTPPGFPSVHSDGLSPKRRRELEEARIEALDAFGELPELEPDLLEGRNLTEEEHELFTELQRQAYAATKLPKYIPLRFNRADGCVKHRECALVYDPQKRRYLFLAYLLDKGSRYKRMLQVKSDLFDVNNPTVKLAHGRRPSSCMLFELEFDTHQQQVLDQARQDAGRWKETDGSSSGSIRSATLHAHYSKERRRWWFEVHLSIGIKPTHFEQPERVVGVHVDPLKGMMVTVLGLDGAQQAQFRLDERAIAEWTHNKNPDQQASLKPSQRTTKEYQHRVANALVAICTYYQAQLGVENIAYRHTTPGPDQRRVHEQDSSQTIVGLTKYKLAQVNLPGVIDVKGISPKRDCSQCGQRHAESQVEGITFRCSACDHAEDRYANTSREVARCVLWILAKRQRPKSTKQKKTTITA